MNAPAIVIGLSLVGTAVLIGLHSNQRTSAMLASAIAGLVAALVFLVPIEQARNVLGLGFRLDSSLSLLGRSLVLDNGNRAGVSFLYASGAFYFLAGVSVYTSRYLFSAGMLALTAMAASLMVAPFLFAAVFILLATLSAVVVLADPELPAVTGALRLLGFSLISMVTILTAGWLLETSGVSTATPELALRVGQFLAVGFAVLLLVPPFHLWLLPAADRSHPQSVAFLAVLMTAAGAFFLLRFFNAHDWLRSASAVGIALQIGGGTLVLIGGFGALAARDLVCAVFQLMLMDLGIGLLAVSPLNPAAYALLLAMIGTRSLALGLGAFGLNVLRGTSTKLGSTDLRGMAYSSPLLCAAVIVSMLSLAGAPLTAGFPGRWGVITAATGWPTAMLVLFGLIVGLAVSLRWLSWMLQENDQPLRRELSAFERGLLLMAVAAVLLLGLFPQAISPWVASALNGLPNLTG